MTPVPAVDRPSLLAACRAGLGSEPPEVAASEAGARTLLAWVLERIARRRWSKDDLRAGFCTRTPREILAQAQVAFTAPCADLSSVAALVLAARGFPVTLVLGGIARPFRPIRFHCGLEVELSGESWVAGFGVSRAVFYRGRFVATRKRPWLYRRCPEALDLDRPYLGYFVPEGRDGLGPLVPGYDLGRDIRDHAWRSGWFAFRIAARRARRVGPPPAIPAAVNWDAA